MPERLVEWAFDRGLLPVSVMPLPDRYAYRVLFSNGQVVDVARVELFRERPRLLVPA